MFDLRNSLSGSSKTEVLSGITVALALVPEAVAFAFVAGVPPLVALYAAFIMCLGPLFFGSVTRFRDLFDPQTDPDDVIIDFYFSRVYDQSGLEAINALAARYQKLGKQLHLRHLSEDCRRLLDRAGDLVEVNIFEDPHYHVATDNPQWRS